VAHPTAEAKGWRGSAGAPRYPGEASPAPGVFVDSRRESKDRIGMPTPPRHFAERGCKRLKTKAGARKKRGKSDTRGCKPMGGKELAGLKGRRRVICRANMMEVIILVYRLSSDFLSTCKFKIAKGLAQNLGLREKSKPCRRKGRRETGALGSWRPAPAVGEGWPRQLCHGGILRRGLGGDKQVFT
jgi:hypothetical protein